MTVSDTDSTALAETESSVSVFDVAAASSVFGGVRDGASNVRKFSALATSSMCATEVNSVSVVAASAWLVEGHTTDDVGLPQSLPFSAAVSRLGSTSALELKSMLSFSGCLLAQLSSAEVLSLFKSANCTHNHTNEKHSR